MKATPHIIATGFLALFAGLAQGQMTKDSAFSAGLSSGGDTHTNAVAAGIGNGKASEVLQGFDPKARPAGVGAFDGNLISSLRQAGVKKTNDCAVSANAGDAAAIQQCEAVNAIVKQTSNPPPTSVVPVNDPLIAKASEIVASPEVYAGSISSVSGTYSGCVTKTVTKVGSSRTETCDIAVSVGQYPCSTGMLVDVDADFIYACRETIKTQADSYCTLGKTFVVDTKYNYQCETTLAKVNTHTCNRKVSADSKQAHELAKGQQCYGWAGYGVPGASYAIPIEFYGLPQLREATTKADQGYRELWVAGNLIGRYTDWQIQNCYIGTKLFARGVGSVSPVTGNNPGGYLSLDRGILAIWKDAGAYITPGSDTCGTSLNRLGYGAYMNLCKKACSNVSKIWVCGGKDGTNCNYTYQCQASERDPDACPAGWTDLGDSCREPEYEQYLANGCTLLETKENPLDATGNDTIHNFVCPTVTDGCASYANR